MFFVERPFFLLSAYILGIFAYILLFLLIELASGSLFWFHADNFCMVFMKILTLMILTILANTRHSRCWWHIWEYCRWNETERKKKSKKNYMKFVSKSSHSHLTIKVWLFKGKNVQNYFCFGFSFFSGSFDVVRHSCELEKSCLTWTCLLKTNFNSTWFPSGRNLTHIFFFRLSSCNIFRFYHSFFEQAENLLELESMQMWNSFVDLHSNAFFSQCYCIVFCLPLPHSFSLSRLCMVCFFFIARQKRDGNKIDSQLIWISSGDKTL